MTAVFDRELARVILWIVAVLAMVESNVALVVLMATALITSHLTETREVLIRSRR